jgi:hypothetical protein
MHCSKSSYCSRVPEVYPLPHENHKQPSDHWKGTIDLLLKLMNIGSEAGVPGFWHKLANANMKEAHAIIQEQQLQLQLHVSSVGLPEPIATMELASTITNLQFASRYK